MEDLMNIIVGCFSSTVYSDRGCRVVDEKDGGGKAGQQSSKGG